MCRPDLSFVPHAQEKDGNLCGGNVAVDGCTDIWIGLLDWISYFASGYHLGQCGVHIVYRHDHSQLRLIYLEWICPEKR